jgi:hypothetical protein
MRIKIADHMTDKEKSTCRLCFFFVIAGLIFGGVGIFSTLYIVSSNLLFSVLMSSYFTAICVLALAIDGQIENDKWNEVLEWQSGRNKSKK